MSDHNRLLKERTLAIEVAHANATGGTLRDAENANMRALERLEARKRYKKPSAKAAPRKFEHREITKKELAAHNVTRKPAPPKKVIPPPCKFCGTCRWCSRFKRTQEIMRKARLGDANMLALGDELAGLALAAQQRSDYRDALGVEYPFSRIVGFTANRAVTAGIESVCDRSTRWLGPWR